MDRTDDAAAYIPTVSAEVAAEAAFRIEIVAQDDLDKDGWIVEYFTFRLTQSGARADVQAVD